MISNGRIQYDSNKRTNSDEQRHHKASEGDMKNRLRNGALQLSATILHGKLDIFKPISAFLQLKIVRTFCLPRSPLSEEGITGGHSP